MLESLYHVCDIMSMRIANFKTCEVEIFTLKAIKKFSQFFLKSFDKVFNTKYIKLF